MNDIVLVCCDFFALEEPEHEEDVQTLFEQKEF